MNTRILMVLAILISMIGTVSAATTEHVEGNYTYDGPNENLEMTADWDYTVTERPNRHVTIIEGEANAHAEYTYINEEDHTEFVGANGHIDGKAKFKYGGLKRADINVNGNVYTGHENVEHFDAVSYYDEETGHRVTVSAYDVVERYENGYEFEGYLKVRNYRVRPASYFTWTPYEQHTWNEMGKNTERKVRSRDSLETGIIAYIGLPTGATVESYIRTSTANNGAGTPMIVVVPGYTVGEEPWSATQVNNPHQSVVRQNE